MPEHGIEATVIIMTKNEALDIARAVRSADGFADVLVVDSHSTDDTVSQARALGARVVQFDWDGRYPKKKEWSMSHALFDWVVYVDADEYLTDELTAEIAGVVARDDVGAFSVGLSYHWMGRELLHGHRVHKTIGIRRSVARWPHPDDLDVANMWEVEGHYQPSPRRGKTATLDHRLGHEDHDGLYAYFERHNRYSDWEAAMHGAGRSSRIGVKAAVLAAIPLKPLAFFVYAFLVRRGFLDGRAGLDYALAMSMYHWQVGLKVRERRREIASGIETGERRRS